jgi:hypothetical protein
VLFLIPMWLFGIVAITCFGKSGTFSVSLCLRGSFAVKR